MLIKSIGGKSSKLFKYHGWIVHKYIRTAVLHSYPTAQAHDIWWLSAVYYQHILFVLQRGLK